MPSFIQTEIESGVASLTLKRPEKKNALTREFIQEMAEFVNQIHADETIRLFVLRAEGDVFCAGMDLAQMKGRLDSTEPEQEYQRDSEVYNHLVSQIFDLPFPSLAILPGPALAGGTGMVFACDLVLASDNTFFSLPEPKRGIVAAMVCPLLVYRSNAAVASFLLFSGQKLTASEALAHGLVHQVVPNADLEVATDSMIQSILTGSNEALRLTKKHLRQVTNIDVVPQIQESTSVSAEARRSADAQEGLAAFLEKRSPNWVKSHS